MTTTFRKSGEKAIETVIYVSKKRLDCKWKLIQNKSNLKMHNSCYDIYIRKESINKHIKDSQKKEASRRKSFDRATNFEYEKFCFICESSNKRKQYFVPTSVDCISNMVNYLQSLDSLTENERLLVTRLNVLAQNFENIKCFYHHHCYAKLYQYKSNKVIGRPMNDDMRAALNFVIDHVINNADECQFSVRKILESCEDDVSEVTMCELKNHLLNHFDNDIRIDSENLDLIIRF